MSPPGVAHYQVIARATHSPKSLGNRWETRRIPQVAHLRLLRWVNTVAHFLKLPTWIPDMLAIQQDHKGVRFVALFVYGKRVSIPGQKSSRKPRPQTSESKVSYDKAVSSITISLSLRLSPSPNPGPANGSKRRLDVAFMVTFCGPERLSCLVFCVLDSWPACLACWSPSPINFCNIHNSGEPAIQN